MCVHLYVEISLVHRNSVTSDPYTTLYTVCRALHTLGV